MNNETNENLNSTHITPQQEQPKEQDKEAKFIVERIGSIPFTAHGHHYGGSKIITFHDQAGTINEPHPSTPGLTVARTKVISAEDQVNKFFSENQNLLLVDWRAFHGGVTIIVTNTLNDIQMKVLKHRGNLIEQEVKKLMQEEEDAERASLKKLEDEEAKLRELAKVGEHCQKNHGSVIKKLRKGK